MIQTLSAEPGFGLQLSLPVKVQLPAKWNLPGTTADFMVTVGCFSHCDIVQYSNILAHQSIYTLVVTSPASFSTLYPALVISLANAGPQIKHLSQGAATKLLQLLSIFANPAFLLADESHPRLVFFTLEAINAILHHHPAENPNAVYAILKHHAVFERLGTFTLAGGLREARRAQEQGTGKGRGEGKGRAGEVEGERETAVEEKARLLAAEGSTRSGSVDLEAGPAGRATTSSAAAAAAAGAATSPEKARGRSRDRSESVDSAPVERALAAEIGRNGFVPTQEWVRSIVSWPQGRRTNGFPFLQWATGDILATRVSFDCIFQRPQSD